MAYRQTPTTAAFEYQLNTAEFDNDVTVTVDGTLASDESIEFICPGSGSATDSNLYIDGVQIKITPLNSLVRLTGNCLIIVKKGVTDATVGFRLA